ncbi:ATP-binding protein [Lysobacter solisilvae (ex Woo and Kim 2020)]|uniref:histidine kinase n=1 Tax=Agrilutibacter terrestris TaxID=2865112 RepID=A0A7H0FU50_9GAMM|nr:ATP-binding protein [Lysobacter terrestris]QNP39566.1 CHASE3 domain-containing protein [Lysobacter terrestris]
MRPSATRFYNFAFVLGLALLAALAWQGKRTQDQLLAANRSVAHTAELISVIQRLLSTLQDVEGGARGYAITGDRRFLEPYTRGRQRLAADRSRLGAMLATRVPAQWLQQLDRDIQVRLGSSATAIAVRERAGLVPAADYIARGIGKQAMDRIRSRLGDIENRQRDLLEHGQARLAQSMARARRLFWAGVVVAGLLLAGALQAMNRNLRTIRQLAHSAQAGESRLGALFRALPDTLFELQPDGHVASLARPAQGGLLGLPSQLVAAMRERRGRHADAQTFFWSEEGGRDYEIRMSEAEAGSRLVIARDVTDATRSRRMLRDQQAFLRNIVDTDENLIFVRDHEGRFVLCNRAFAALAGLAVDRIEGHTLNEIATDAQLAPLLQGYGELIEGSLAELRLAEVGVFDAAGRERWLQLVKRPLLLSDGSRSVLSVAVDLSMRREVDQMKSEFVSTISHELRTPLTSIQGALDLLAQGDGLATAERNLLAIARRNSDRLLQLIGEILDLDKLGSGRLQIDARPLALRPLVALAIAHTQPYAHSYGVELVLAAGDDGIVRVDPHRFEQVMANLLSNAAKHSPQGGTVTASVQRVGDMLEVAVADRGGGIPEEFRGRVFERFAQADASNVRRRGGTGLGLAITRALVEQMHGTIGFATESGAGTRFHVRFPLIDTQGPSSAA